MVTMTAMKKSNNDTLIILCVCNHEQVCGEIKEWHVPAKDEGRMETF